MDNVKTIDLGVCNCKNNNFSDLPLFKAVRVGQQIFQYIRWVPVRPRLDWGVLSRVKPLAPGGNKNQKRGEDIPRRPASKGRRTMRS